jgi:hypothetical protein
MVRAEEAASRASAIDERDHQVLLHLLEHKILTTHQITSLCFRSLRRCQHRMRELKEMGLVSSFQVGRGFGEGRAPACWYLTKAGLVEIADAKEIRTSDLPWVPDPSYRSNKLLAHRLGVNAFFCALAEASRALQGHCLATWRPEHWVGTKSGDVKPDGFGRYLHPGGACEFYFEYDRATEASGALTRKLEGYLRLGAGWTREQELTGFPNLLVLVPEEERGGKSPPSSVLPSGTCTPRARWRARSRCTSRARTGSPRSASSDRSGNMCPPTAIACPSSTSQPDRETCTEPHDVSVGTSPTPTLDTDAASPLHPPHPDSAPCRPDMPLEAAARGRANRSRTPSPAQQERRGHGEGTRTAARRSRPHRGTG